MKKTIFGIFLAMMLVLLGISVVVFASQEDTTERIDKVWTLTSQTIDEIYIGGTNQPINLVIERTENPETRVVVTGKVSERSLESLVDAAYTTQSDNQLILAFEKWKSGLGTSHININEEGRAVVIISVQLAKNAQLKRIQLDNAGGEISVKLPADLAVAYKLDTHDLGRVVGQTRSAEVAETSLEINNYGGNIIVQK